MQRRIFCFSNALVVRVLREKFNLSSSLAGLVPHSIGVAIFFERVSFQTFSNHLGLELEHVERSLGLEHSRSRERRESKRECLAWYSLRTVQYDVSNIMQPFSG